MIPGLPSLLRLGLVRASRWRVLALFSTLALVASAAAVLPLWAYLAGQLDHAVGPDATGPVTTGLLLELTRGLSENGGGVSIGLGLVGGLALSLLLGPWSAGAAMAEARAEAPLRFRALLGAAGQLYGRLLRLWLVALIPLGAAAGVSAALVHHAGDRAAHALTEAEALAAQRHGLWGALAVVFLAQLTVEAARAELAARPERRSALLAWAAGSWLVLRRPVRTLVSGALGVALALLASGAFMALRGRLPSGAGFTALGFLLATLASAGVAWGRAVRLGALAELAAHDEVVRAERRARRAERKQARRAAKQQARQADGAPAPVAPALPLQPDAPAAFEPALPSGVPAAPEPASQPPASPATEAAQAPGPAPDPGVADP
ncbi:MAG: hypothetical protein QM767_29650 [Anaeromyxobacter sp.]